MPHVEPGELHALLDGAYGSDSVEGARLRAHLAGCTDCRSLLEEERLVRERANELLELAVPTALNTPPFAQLEVRARQRTRRWGRTELSWAATLVLALGIGWFGHDLAARKGVDVAPSPVQPTTEQKQEAAPPAAPGPAAAEQPLREQAARDLTANQRGGEPRQETAVQEDRARMTAGAATMAAPPSAPVPEPVAQRAPPWVETSLENAERTLGRRVLLLPGFELVRLELGPGDGSVRVFQRIPNDGMIELLQEPIARESGRAEAAASRERRNTADAAAAVSINLDNLRITARGPLAADSLRVLLGRLR